MKYIYRCMIEYSFFRGVGSITCLVGFFDSKEEAQKQGERALKIAFNRYGSCNNPKIDELGRKDYIFCERIYVEDFRYNVNIYIDKN